MGVLYVPRAVAPLLGAPPGSQAAAEWAAAASPFPPLGFLLCGACGVEFARRSCCGAGCAPAAEGGGGVAQGTAYCWPCFVAYHPRKEAAWAPHWEPARRGGTGGGSERLAVAPQPRDPRAVTVDWLAQLRGAVEAAAAAAAGEAEAVAEAKPALVAAAPAAAQGLFPAFSAAGGGGFVVPQLLVEE